MTTDDLLPLLCCPKTGEALVRKDDCLVSKSGATYPLVQGIPVLIDEQQSLFTVADYQDRTGGVRAGRSKMEAFLLAIPSCSLNVAADANFAALGRLLAERSAATNRRQRVLVLGAGEGGEGLSRLLEYPSVDVVNTDVTPTRDTDVICDAHRLPFVAETFDAVVCQAVLEHVLDPLRVVSEIARILPVGGLVYSEVPFMQQVHAGAYDFTRFTHLGHRRLFREFEEIASGVAGGPAMALAWSWRYFLVALAGRSRVGRAAALRAAAVTTFWLKHLDRYLARQPGGLDAAATTYFLGRRAPEPIPDREIVRGYRGAQRIRYGANVER